MAIFASIFAALGRFLGRILTMALGWASVLLFGRVPQSKQLLLSLVSFGSLIWVVFVLGIFFPFVGALLFGVVPDAAANAVGAETAKTIIRVVMLVAAIVMPALIGFGGLILIESANRPKGAGLVKQVLRGYVYTPVLAIVLVFMAIIAPARKVRSLLKRWTDAHIPVVVKPGGYERVADDVEAALDGAGLEIERVGAPRVLELPAKLVARVTPGGGESLVPERLIVLRNKALEVLVYPSDVSISGKKADLAKARAAIASRLTFTAAYLTTAKETQVVEDRLAKVADGNLSREAAAREFEAIDRDMAALDVTYDDWSTLYRLRLQVERNVLATGDGQADSSPTEAAQENTARDRRAAAPAVLVPAGGAALTAAAIPLLLMALERMLGGTPLRRVVGLVRRAVS